MGAGASVESEVDQFVASAVQRQIKSVIASVDATCTSSEPLGYNRQTEGPVELLDTDKTPTVTLRKEHKSMAESIHENKKATSSISTADRLPFLSGSKPSLRSFALKKLSTLRNVYIPQEPNMVGSFMMRAGPQGLQAQSVSGTSASSSFQKSSRGGPDAIAEDVSHPGYFGDITMVSEHSSSEGSLLNRSGTLGPLEQGGESHLMSMLDEGEEGLSAEVEGSAVEDDSVVAKASPASTTAAAPQPREPPIRDNKALVPPPTISSISKLHGINLTIDVTARAPPPSDRATSGTESKTTRPNLTLQIDIPPAGGSEQKKPRKPSLSISVNTEDDEKDWIPVSARSPHLILNF
jgi:hypothetical protein